MNYQQVVDTVNKVIREYTIKLTVRQLYYRLISPPYQLFGNSLNNYKGMDKILTKARERGEVDWTKIEDRARATIGGEGYTFDSPEEYVKWVFSTLNESYFKRSFWDDQPNYVEVWVEKDALAGLFQQACEDFRVVVFPSRGYSSFTKVMEAAGRFDRREQSERLILHFSDHDPSGLDMTKDLRTRFAEYGASVKIKRIALTYNQVKELDLAPNPTKKADARSPAYEAEYGEECWELDAVPPDTLQEWIKEAVQEEIDEDVWKETEERVESEKDRIKKAIDESKADIERVAKRVKKRLEEEE